MGAFVLRNEAGQGVCPNLPHAEEILNTANVSPRESGMVVGFETVPEAEARRWDCALSSESLGAAKTFDDLWIDARGGSVRMDYTPVDDTDANACEVVFREGSKRMTGTTRGVRIEFELLEVK